MTGNWFLGLIGVLSVACLVLGVAQQSRRLFGKHPPLSEEVNRMDQERRREMLLVTQDCERRHTTLRGEMDERFRDLAIENARSLGELHEKINAVASDLAFIKGKLASKS